MSKEEFVTRRRMLALTGGTAMVGLAGCTGGSDGDDGGSGQQDTPTATATATATETHSDDDGHHDDGTDSHDDGTESHDDEDGHHHGDDEIGEPTDSKSVSMVTNDAGFHFDPHVVRVNVGGTVTFVNQSGSHSAKLYHSDNDEPQLAPEGSAAWDSGLLEDEGAEFDVTLETEGVYHYYCEPHESNGMIGSIIVGEPDAHGQPALEEVPQDKPEAVRSKLEELNTMVNEALGHTH